MKKATKAATKKTAKPAVKKAAAKTAAPKKAAVKLAPAAPKKAARKAPAKASIAPPNQPKTTIIANIDVGFGNSLYLRGDAPGLSWSKGVPMDCASGSSWSISIAGVVETFEFKVLINDSYWSSGYNHSAVPGETIVVNPVF